MKTEIELNKEIVKITTMIRESYPELSQFIGEMPVKLSYMAGDTIHDKNLKDYLDSLKTLVGSYSRSHLPEYK